MNKSEIDIKFNFYSDSNGKDPDSASPTLRRYHKLLWSKILPNGYNLNLKEDVPRTYLFHHTDIGKFYLGSDAITHSYKNHTRKAHIVKQIPKDVDELYDKGSTIGGYILFPNNRIDKKHTINQARGVNRLIDDRFDLTLECIRRYYLDLPSPLYDTIKRYSDFFNLFQDFIGYVNFFLLNDLIDEEQNIRFYLPFDDFHSPPKINSTDDYLNYKNKVIAFIKNRNERILDYSKTM